MDLCEFNETGEIYIAGYNLARGYVGTKEHPSFVPNPFSKTSGFNRLYRTGDFGKIIDTPGGSKLLAYEGRVDSQIKVRGQRVDLAEIELVLAEVELVSKVKVLCYHPGQDDQVRGTQIYFYFNSVRATLQVPRNLSGDHSIRCPSWREQR
jgi:acyl-CoA synthetase (AMP-forming)/AMP-acid ligase II